MKGTMSAETADYPPPAYYTVDQEELRRLQGLIESLVLN